jgi:hypothetical protein
MKAMMNPDQIRNYHEVRPFQPFEIRMSNGHAYTVDHSEFLAFTRDRSVIVYFTDDSREVRLALSQIASIEKTNHPTAA